MLTLLTAEWINYLKIQQSKEEGFVYYTLNALNNEYWNIIGVHFVRDDPLLVDIRLLYIDQDARDWEDFVAEKNAPGMMVVNPASYSDIIILLEPMLSMKVASEDSSNMKYYRNLTEPEMATYHYPLQIEKSVNDRCYLYQPPTERRMQSEESIICFPRWDSHMGKNQAVGFWFVTVSQKQLADPNFDLFMDADGLGTIRFDEQSLFELIVLLKRYAFG